MLRLFISALVALAVSTIAAPAGRSPSEPPRLSTYFWFGDPQDSSGRTLDLFPGTAEPARLLQHQGQTSSPTLPDADVSASSPSTSRGPDLNLYLSTAEQHSKERLEARVRRFDEFQTKVKEHIDNFASHWNFNGDYNEVIPIIKARALSAFTL